MAGSYSRVESIRVSILDNIQYTTSINTKAMANMNIPEASCKNPWAVSGLTLCTIMAVSMSRSTFTPMAMGTVEKKRSHLPGMLKSTN
jgi:hypothetical protein